MSFNKLDDDYTSWVPMYCITCKHLRGYVSGIPTCHAFPSGIPVEIWRDKVSHKYPHPNDHGIQYEEDMSIDLDDVVLLDENEL